MTKKSIIEDTVDGIGGPAFDREHFAEVFPANRAQVFKTGDYRVPQRRTSSFDLSADLRAQDTPQGNDYSALLLTPGGIIAIGPIGTYYAQNFERIANGTVETFRRKSSRAA